MEVGNLTGYVPTTYLSEKNPFEGVDLWQDEEYFSSYGDVVGRQSYFFTLQCVVLDEHVPLCFHVHSLRSMLTVGGNPPLRNCHLPCSVLF